jgi:sec-independent protein translocase protein TatA
MFEGLFQPMHLLVIVIVALLIFGPKSLPAIGKGLGEAICGFKKHSMRRSLIHLKLLGRKRQRRRATEK